ncbi:hypothetical protein ACQJBY_027516 [Aegilops geniculata]
MAPFVSSLLLAEEPAPLADLLARGPRPARLGHQRRTPPPSCVRRAPGTVLVVVCPRSPASEAPFPAPSFVHASSARAASPCLAVQPTRGSLELCRARAAAAAPPWMPSRRPGLGSGGISSGRPRRQVHRRLLPPRHRALHPASPDAAPASSRQRRTSASTSPSTSSPTPASSPPPSRQRARCLLLACPKPSPSLFFSLLFCFSEYTSLSLCVSSCRDPMGVLRAALPPLCFCFRSGASWSPSHKAARPCCHRCRRPQVPLPFPCFCVRAREGDDQRQVPLPHVDPVRTSTSSVDPLQDTRASLLCSPAWAAAAARPSRSLPALSPTDRALAHGFGFVPEL